MVPGWGIVCANFGHQQPGREACKGAWHAKCYEEGESVKFPRVQVLLEGEEEGGFELEDDDSRFRSARDGDHLMCPFQCDGCHFRNIKGRNPSSELKDELLLTYIRRATLDAFWACESSTVTGNLRETMKITKSAQLLGIPDPCKVVAMPFPLKDSWGVGVACIVLL